MTKIYNTKLSQDGWIVCDKCGKRIARYDKDGSYGKGITTKCNRCKAIVKFEFVYERGVNYGM